MNFTIYSIRLPAVIESVRYDIQIVRMTFNEVIAELSLCYISEEADSDFVGHWSWTTRGCRRLIKSWPTHIWPMHHANPSSSVPFDEMKRRLSLDQNSELASCCASS